jgi:MFS family permease
VRRGRFRRSGQGLCLVGGAAVAAWAAADSTAGLGTVATMTDLAKASAPWRSMPATVWVLGFGSMFMDIASELVHSVLPIFMATVLHSSMATIGLVEGVAEAAAAITKVFSGALSDWLGRRKPLLLLGYGLAAITKPVFPLAPSIGWVFAARFVDRVGKGIRGAPRDALVADVTLPERRGAAYGLRQALDSIGAFVGPLLAVVLMMVFAENLQLVMWAAVLPAVVTVLLLWRFVREPEQHAQAEGARSGLHWADLRRLPTRFWGVVLLGGVFTLARFSEAFLVLRAQDVGLPVAQVPLVMIAMNLVYAALAYPAGHAGDKWPARSLLVAGLLALVAADAVLAWARSPVQAFGGAVLWGLHMALTQGLFNKLVADAAPADLRGSAFGFFNLASGVALLLASVIAGALWSAHGPAATFMAGAVFSALAAAGLLLSRARSSAAPAP